MPNVTEEKLVMVFLEGLNGRLIRVLVPEGQIPSAPAVSCKSVLNTVERPCVQKVDRASSAA